MRANPVRSTATAEAVAELGRWAVMASMLKAALRSL